MVLSEDVTDFDLNTLLVGDEDPYSLTRTITITIDPVIDEDGDNAVNIKLQSNGLDAEAIQTILAIAHQMAQELDDDEDWEDEDDD